MDGQKLKEIIKCRVYLPQDKEEYYLTLKPLTGKSSFKLVLSIH